MSRTNFKELLQAGVHFGHLKKKYNPAMAPYIFMERGGIHIIDLNKTVAMIEDASAALKQIAKSGKKKYKFDITQENFAWMADNKKEKKMIKTMKKGSRIMVTGYNQKGSQTIDDYSLLGFTKAYNAAKKACT